MGGHGAGSLQCVVQLKLLRHAVAGARLQAHEECAYARGIAPLQAVSPGIAAVAALEHEFWCQSPSKHIYAQKLDGCTGPRTQATSSRHYGEKDARLEYLSWRVWHLKRKKHMVRKEELDRRARAIVEDDSGPPMTEEETSDEDAVGAAQRAKSDSGRQVPRLHPLQQAQPSYPHKHSAACTMLSTHTL